MHSTFGGPDFKVTGTITARFSGRYPNLTRAEMDNTRIPLEPRAILKASQYQLFVWLQVWLSRMDHEDTNPPDCVDDLLDLIPEDQVKRWIISLAAIPNNEATCRAQKVHKKDWRTYTHQYVVHQRWEDDQRTTIYKATLRLVCCILFCHYTPMDKR